MAINPIIKQKAEDIRKKIFGSEVRESLASGIEAISEDVEATIGRQDYVEEQFQNVIDETTDKDVISAPELIAARNGKSNLKTRLDDEHEQVTAQLQQTEQELNAKLAQITYLVPINKTTSFSDEIMTLYNNIPEHSTLKIPAGKWEIDKPLKFDRKVNLDFLGVDLEYVGTTTSPAVSIGIETGSIRNITVKGLNVLRKNLENRRTEVNEIGIRLLNLQYSKVEFSAHNFYNNVVVDSINGHGNVYNHYTIGWVYSGQNNLVLRTSDSGSWTNENNFYGGSFSFESNISTSDNINLKIEHNDYRNNNNRFFGCSFEDAGLLAYAIDCEGSSTYFYSCRYEGSKKVKFGKKSARNTIMFGFGSNQLTVEDSGTYNNVLTDVFWNLKTRLHIDTTSLSDDVLKISYQGTESFKVTADGSVTGSLVSSTRGYRFGNQRGLFNGSGNPNGSVTAGPGSIYVDTGGGREGLYFKVSTLENTGWERVQTVFANSSSNRPPSPSRGFQFFDVTLKKPIWWSGDNWVDATGANV